MYDFQQKKPIDSLDTLLKSYDYNNAQLQSLNITKELLQNQIVNVMRQTQPFPFVFKTSFYNNLYKFINKELKRGEDGYKTTKTSYDYIVDELQKNISPDIKKIDKVIERIGYGYTTIAEEIIFTLNDNEFELHIPIPNNITVEDVFSNGYIDIHVTDFQLYAKVSSCGIQRIWTGSDISKIKDEVDLTKNYREDNKNDNKESK